MKTKRYINQRTEERTTSASIALKWHNQGDTVQVDTLNSTGSLNNSVSVVGVKKNDPDRENFETCKDIANKLEAYVDGCYYTCPDCGEKIKLPDDVGDKYKCPDCGEIHDVDDLEQLGLYDYFEDILDIEYLVDSKKQYKACKICVAYGGPSIYIDTETCNVELYWWGSRASYRILNSAVDAVDEWAEEYFNCL